MTYIDLSHVFEKHMPVFPGNPQSELVQVDFMAKGDDCNIFEVKTGMHVGTHVDAPLHMIEGAKGLKDFLPEHFFGNGVLVDAREHETIDVDLLAEKQLAQDDIVLILTGRSSQFGEDSYFQNYPVLTEGFAKKMVDVGVKMVGMDSASPDEAPYSVHKILLGNDVLIIENLTNLENLLAHTHFEIIALPPLFDSAGSPIRVVAKIA